LYSLLNSYGYFVTRLGFGASSVLVLNFNGHLGTQRFLGFTIACETDIVKYPNYSKALVRALHNYSLSISSGLGSNGSSNPRSSGISA